MIENGGISINHDKSILKDSVWLRIPQSHSYFLILIVWLMHLIFIYIMVMLNQYISLQIIIIVSGLFLFPQDWCKLSLLLGHSRCLPRSTDCSWSPQILSVHRERDNYWRSKACSMSCFQVCTTENSWRWVLNF